MFKELEEKLKKIEGLQQLVADPKVISNPAEYKKYAKELSAIQKMADKYNEYKKTTEEIASLEHVINAKDEEEEFLKLAHEELASLKKKNHILQKKLTELLTTEDEEADRNIIMEIRQGTGGVEAALFAQDLFRMYSRYATKRNWNVEVMSTSLTEKGGFKEIICAISGERVYGRMKYESGAHRVQRVPITESSGRIHTSVATVAVLPEAEEVDIEIKPQDLRIDVFRAGGRGGQHVNVTDSAVRITHMPTGLVVSCQDERSQYKNKTKALRVLRARIFDKMKQEQQKKISQDRKTQVGSGDRSEKIRTYNFPDRRVTDHRIGFSTHSMENVLNGELDEIMDALAEADRKLRFK
ncbi:MAG: peptide chain release factor 1 [Omnitrophica bacterium RBG_13_46_9]|nr:MAG: peptide chain release factor 1 [Omnitrophica bacterium RBG_13_46_9]